jgi:hypothetical protein
VTTTESTTSTHLTPERLTSLECGAAILAVTADADKRLHHAASIALQIIRKFPQIEGQGDVLLRAVSFELGHVLLREMELVPLPSEIACMVAEIRRLRQHNELAVHALELVQWSADRFTDDAAGRPYQACPLCERAKDRGHKPECLVGEALEKAE